MKITQERLMEVLEYNPQTGHFTNLIARGTRKVGEILKGTLNQEGYLQLMIDGKQYLTHRLAFLYMTGEWPKEFIDHKDTLRSNNKWLNLREADRTINARNRSMQKNNTSGVTGVSWSKDTSKWFASICVDGKMIYLGRFEYMEDAIFARMTAEKKYNYWVDKVWEQL